MPVIRIPPLLEGWTEHTAERSIYAMSYPKDAEDIRNSFAWCNWDEKKLMYFEGPWLVFRPWLELHERFHPLTGLPDCEKKNCAMSRHKGVLVWGRTGLAAFERSINGESWPWLCRDCAVRLEAKLKGGGPND